MIAAALVVTLIAAGSVTVTSLEVLHPFASVMV
jgi:hypothetical protein